MTAALALLGLAVVLALAGQRVVAGRDWARRAPRLAVAVWVALVVSTLLSILLAALAVAIPPSSVATGFTGLLAACLATLQSALRDAEPASLSAAFALGVAVALVGRLAGALVAELTQVRRHRRRHAEALSLLAAGRGPDGSRLLPHAEPAAYCVPGRRGQVVITTGATTLLAPAQLRAVLAHERAHLAGHHHLVLVAAVVVDRAFPSVPLFRAARRGLAHLVELLADDAATRDHDRATLASALVAVACGHAPAGALAAGADDVIVRVRRLLEPGRPVRPAARLGALAGVAALVAAPLLIGGTPAAGASDPQACARVVAARHAAVPDLSASSR